MADRFSEPADFETVTVTGKVPPKQRTKAPEPPRGSSSSSSRTGTGGGGGGGGRLSKPPVPARSAPPPPPATTEFVEPVLEEPDEPPVLTVTGSKKFDPILSFLAPNIGFWRVVRAPAFTKLFTLGRSGLLGLAALPLAALLMLQLDAEARLRREIERDREQDSGRRRRDDPTRLPPTDLPDIPESEIPVVTVVGDPNTLLPAGPEVEPPSPGWQLQPLPGGAGRGRQSGSPLLASPDFSWFGDIDLGPFGPPELPRVRPPIRLPGDFLTGLPYRFKPLPGRKPQPQPIRLPETLPEPGLQPEPRRITKPGPRPGVQPYPSPLPLPKPAPRPTPRPVPKPAPWHDPASDDWPDRFTAPKPEPVRLPTPSPRPLIPEPTGFLTPLQPGMGPSPAPTPTPTPFPGGDLAGSPTDPCKCAPTETKRKKPQRREPRTDCYRGTYRQLARGIVYHRLRKIPCR